MKRIASVVLVLLLAAGFTAFSSGKTEGAKPGAGTSTAAVTTKYRLLDKIL